MIDKASETTIRQAIDAVLADGGGSALEATARMSVDQAEEFATRVLVERTVTAKVRTYRKGPWLHIEAFGH
jgi:hypothetical protein